jgi:glycosyltransferase involved in cell wall biosynthesis
MRILLVHNAYQNKGGDDSVFFAEADLLRLSGHIVKTLIISNDEIKGIGSKLSTALLAPYNPFGSRIVRDAITAHQPDIVHVHNFFPRLSASVFSACAKAKIPTIWTLHNYRIACLNGVLFRDGEPCQLCLGKLPVQGILRRCYRGSIMGSLSVAAMVALNRKCGTWVDKVDRFIILAESSKKIFVAAGIPEQKIFVKPNFVHSRATEAGQLTLRNGALFVGRLSPEKGVDTMIEAWKGLDIPLTVIGSGPDASVMKKMAKNNTSITFMDHLSHADVQSAMAAAQVLVVPSRWFEPFGMVVVEAMSASTPVIASRIGALAGIVLDGTSGWLFKPGDPNDLRRVVMKVFASPADLPRIGEQARKLYEKRFSPTRNLEMLISVYESAIEERKALKFCRNK